MYQITEVGDNVLLVNKTRITYKGANAVERRKRFIGYLTQKNLKTALI